MKVACLLVLVLGATACSALLVDDIQITGNPFMPKTPAPEGTCDGTGCQLFVDPTQIIMTPMVTQPDTLTAIVQRKYMGMMIPLYLFRQSPRLTSRPLPFKLLLQRQIDMAGVTELTVPMHQAMDSWFPQYHWSVVVCTGCDGLTHLGWKFTSNAAPGESFYALIVDYFEKEKITADASASMLDAIRDTLRVGMRAPAWMAAMALASATPTHSKAL